MRNERLVAERARDDEADTADRTPIATGQRLLDV